jgi:hypothetical protein
MDSVRLNSKLFTASAPPAERFVPVFHAWIRDKTLGELLIDVADYTHVHNGPAVALIGHATEYTFDLAQGRPGLLFRRKREAPEPTKRLTDALRRTLAAAALLEGTPQLSELRFRTDELLLSVPDRLHAPNQDATLQSWRPALEPVLARLYGEKGFSLAREGTTREPFAVRVRGQSAEPAGQLLQKLAKD